MESFVGEFGTWNEQALRDRIRDDWSGPELLWIEAARGGTVGNPDIVWPVVSQRLFLPVELKAWEVREVDNFGAVVFRARPAQRRLHRLIAQAGMRSAFLALLEDGNIVALPGRMLPNVELPKDPPKLTYVKRIEALGELWIDEKFWRGE